VLVNDITPVGSETSWWRVLVIYNSGNNFEFTLPPERGRWPWSVRRPSLRSGRSQVR
jgi:hypothetical protein